jgi:hypothetical protein
MVREAWIIDPLRMMLVVARIIDLHHSALDAAIKKGTCEYQIMEIDYVSQQLAVSTISSAIVNQAVKDYWRWNQPLTARPVIGPGKEMKNENSDSGYQRTTLSDGRAASDHGRKIRIMGVLQSPSVRVDTGRAKRKSFRAAR